MTNHTITAPYFQTLTTASNSSVPCAMCGRELPEAEAATGPYNAAGELTFLCGTHLRDSRQFINLLADFMIDQRLRFLQLKGAETIRGVVPDAWFLY